MLGLSSVPPLRGVRFVFITPFHEYGAKSEKNGDRGRSLE